MMLAVLLYANMRGVRSVDRLVELCEQDIAFIWLTKEQKPKRDAFYTFIGSRLTSEVLEDLHHQFLCHLEKEGLITLKALFVEGTKIEANVNRYTFVWRGSINYHLADLLDTVDFLYGRHNTLLAEINYHQKYELGEAQMFVIEGMHKVRETMEKNRKRKLTKHKKLSNNTIIEIDGCSPLKLLKLQKNLIMVAEKEEILFVSDLGNTRLSCRSSARNWKAAVNALCIIKNALRSWGKTGTVIPKQT